MPLGDSNLEALLDGGWQTVAVGDEPLAVVLPGAAAAVALPGAQPLQHRVRRMPASALLRDVVTLFVG